jgi:hypothetical protein
LFGLNNNEIQEGNYLSEKFVDDNSRIKKFNGESIYYWTRSSWESLSSIVRRIDVDGLDDVYGSAANGRSGCVPIVVLI